MLDGSLSPVYLCVTRGLSAVGCAPYLPHLSLLSARHRRAAAAFQSECRPPPNSIVSQIKVSLLMACRRRSCHGRLVSRRRRPRHRNRRRPRHQSIAAESRRRTAATAQTSHRQMWGNENHSAPFLGVPSPFLEMFSSAFLSFPHAQTQSRSPLLLQILLFII